MLASAVNKMLDSAIIRSILSTYNSSSIKSLSVIKSSTQSRQEKKSCV